MTGVDTALARLARLQDIQTRRYALFYRKTRTLKGRALETFLLLWPM